MGFKNIFFSLVLGVGLYGSDIINKISIYTENYPPYNMKEKDGTLSGMSVEILEAVLKQLKSNQTIDDVVLTNWSRAYSLALKNDDSMVFSTTRTESREDKFKWVGPITKTVVGVIGLKEKHIKIDSYKDFNNYKIGAVLKDVGESLLLENGVNSANIQHVSGQDAVKLSFLKIKNGRIDLFAYELNAAFQSAKKQGFDIDKYEVVYTLKKGELYFAFNKNISDETIKRWQNALDTVKQNGIYDKIVSKYINN